jgi:hypothetical protein
MMQVMSAAQAGALMGIPERTARDIIGRHGRWGEVADRPVFTELRLQQKAHLEATSIFVFRMLDSADQDPG